MKKLLLVGPHGSGLHAIVREIHEREVARHWAYHPDRFEAVMIMWGAKLDPNRVVETAPFRAPHHTCSAVALVGNESTVLSVTRSPLLCIRPGEASLAHGGTLLLDELGEWKTSVIESLAEVLKRGQSRHSTPLPARPSLVIATAHTIDRRVEKHARILEIAT